jgi:hypothetical protein
LHLIQNKLLRKQNPIVDNLDCFFFFFFSRHFKVFYFFIFKSFKCRQANELCRNKFRFVETAGFCLHLGFPTSVQVHISIFVERDFLLLLLFVCWIELLKIDIYKMKFVFL